MSNSEKIVLPELKYWIPFSKSKAFEKAMRNISPPDGHAGSVVASPSKSNPDYYYHWVRDAARTFRTFIALDYLTKYRDKFDSIIEAYVEFSKLNQSTPTLSKGLGEPKFYVNGLAYNLPWGRPQNDGPAERAIALTRWCNLLMKNKRDNYITAVLYDGKKSSSSVIKADLDFISHHWQDSCFDLWEEVNGTHFYTRMQQRTALREGAALAMVLKDKIAANFYNEQAQKIENDMERFWDVQNRLIKTTIDWRGGINYKYSNLDAAIILGSCYAYSKDFPFYCPNNDKVLATAYALHKAFLNLYPINSINETSNGDPIYPGIGRYPEDKYNPNGGKGNPWFITTLVMSGLCYQASKLFKDDKVVKISAENIDFLSMAISLSKRSLTIKVGDSITSQKDLDIVLSGLKALGDAYLRRVQLHAANDGSLSEQFDLNTGYMLSARDLTWSYIALIVVTDLRSISPINDD